MTNSIRIDTGAVKVEVNDAGECIEFNPADVAWAERFQGMKREILTSANEYPKKAHVLKNIIEVEQKKKQPDLDLIDETEKQGNALRREMCVYMRGVIDDVFGEGTSQKVFGDLMSETAIISFLEQISPYIEIVRVEKIQQYAPPASVKRKKHAMK